MHAVKISRPGVLNDLLRFQEDTIYSHENRFVDILAKNTLTRVRLTIVMVQSCTVLDSLRRRGTACTEVESPVESPNDQTTSHTHSLRWESNPRTGVLRHVSQYSRNK